MRPHKKLEAWKEAMRLTSSIYECVGQFPDSEKFGLISQMKRASISIPSNIAEGAARQTKKEFKQFLFIARGSLSELDTQLELSLNLKLITKDSFDEILEKIDKVNAMLNGLLKSITP
ncbi:four helix bundle protein [Roseivirga sp. E12]|uniref:four helix bundle protein n=1 Tax=Roseivirga sp. E12 TaxID=2819237 RepID=UPI001ABC5B2D|nr:four helix bundle protein [Roseivirga sp. E12]MBO3699116.1 four helix bundle protein [Roseivirga sp. E12]